MPSRRQRTTKATVSPDRCVSRGKGKRGTNPADHARLLKRQKSSSRAVEVTSGQQISRDSPESSGPQQHDRVLPGPQLTRTESAGLSTASRQSADTQLLCTEAFGLEDETTSSPAHRAGQSTTQLSGLPRSSGRSSQHSDLLQRNDSGVCSEIPGSQDMIIELTSLYGFSPYAVQLGTDYFRRLCLVDVALLTSALQHPILRPLVGAPDNGARRTGLPATATGAGIRAFCAANEWVMAILLVCIFIAAKNVESLRYRRLLPSMLSHALNLKVEPDQATTIEVECLQALDWRLGPHFSPAESR